MSEDKPKPFFDEEKKKKAIQWINDKTQGYVCECCKQKHWVLSEDITTPVIFAGGFNLGGQAYPHILMTCVNCGNTKMFNAVVMGLLPARKIEENGGEDAK